MAKTPRTWTGARTPSGLKRVRQAARRHEILGPRRSAAKTLVAKALSVAAAPSEGDATTALIDALSALDRAAKAGAIHPNAAARRKSRLTRKMNAAARRHAGPDRGPRHEADRQGRRREGRQGPHRGRQVDQGQGRPDRGRQGPRRAQQDGPCRGRCRQGRVGDDRDGPGQQAVAPGDQGRVDQDRLQVDREGSAKTTAKASTTKAAAKTSTAKAAAKTSTAKAAPKKKAAEKS